MKSTENNIEFDKQVNGYVVKYRCPSCGRRHKITLERPTNKKIRCKFCKFLIKLNIKQNSVAVS